ncbi:MAG TPA: hypothetical protein VEK11_21570 [Thermoanaerobaculia bacterium]|jgi:hypothetical protein|nr:hypothetical protein [Thermoanaerobaculia bacterium]
MPSDSSRRSTERAEAGQATFEFALALLFLIVMLSVFYQALHFELDAFNRISLLRFKVMQQAHANQPGQAKRYATEVMDFRPVGELTPVLLMFQPIDPTLQYGPKTFHYRKGTKFTEPQPIALLPENEFGLGLMIVAGVGTSEYRENAPRFRDRFRQTSPVWIPGYLADE